MDFEAVRIFLKVAELGSFTRAGEQLGLSKTRISIRVQELETEVGSRLLQRSTRAVRLTPDGEQFLIRARRLTQDADEIASMFQAPSTLRGRVRIDLPVTFARTLFIPRLPEFLATHPQLEVFMSTTDRRVDLLREGFDCVLRIGPLGDSSLVARRLGVLPLLNAASPAYLAKHGTPRTLADLAGHRVVHYSQGSGSEPPSFEYREGTSFRELPLPAVITVNSADAYQAACVAGLGIIQAPRVGLTPLLAAGTLVEILPDHLARPLPVSLLHADARNVPKRVRAMLNWLAQLIEPHLETSGRIVQVRLQG
jgi:DNA-binding transcriptional LysR family regulator